MDIIRQRITSKELVERFTTSYPTLVKAVVDLGRQVMAVDAEWHADLEVLLLEDGSLQHDLWGINLMVHQRPEEFIIYESLINIRPGQKNFSMEITDDSLRLRITQIVDRLVDYHEPMSMHEDSAFYEASWQSGFGCPTIYPCFKHHKLLTLEKWRSFEPLKRPLMIANEFGRARSLISGGHINETMDCYERALELFHITIEAARQENAPFAQIAALLKLRERTARLLCEQLLDINENQNVRDALIAIDPIADRPLHSDAVAAGPFGS